MINFAEEKWGLVLAGGGGKGAYQIGVFRALCEKNISDCIVGVSGASVGALNLALFAMKDQKKSESVWSKVSPDKFLDIDPDMIDMKEGFVSRDGLTEIIDNDIDLECVRSSDMSLYADVTDCGKDGLDEGKVKYFSLNYREIDDIKKILLASSALPAIYEPVDIEGIKYRDGGLMDNLPISPLYAEGIRNFIVIGLSTQTKIRYEKYSDARFILIKPKYSIGEFWDGTLDFTAKGARKRMEIGYIDAIRELEFSDKDMSKAENMILHDSSVERDYKKLEFEFRKSDLESEVNRNMSGIDDIIKRYT